MGSQEGQGVSAAARANQSVASEGAPGYSARISTEGDPMRTVPTLLAVWVSLALAVPALRADRPHWAFQPVGVVAVPVVRDRAWVANPIDAFVLARLEARGWK